MMIISREEWDQRRYFDQCDADEREAAKPKPFQHRIMPISKCPECKMALHIRGQQVCSASGERVTETTGLSDCAYVPRS